MFEDVMKLESGWTFVPILNKGLESTINKAIIPYFKDEMIEMGADENQIEHVRVVKTLYSSLLEGGLDVERVDDIFGNIHGDILESLVPNVLDDVFEIDPKDERDLQLYRRVFLATKLKNNDENAAMQFLIQTSFLLVGYVVFSLCEDGFDTLYSNITKDKYELTLNDPEFELSLISGRPGTTTFIVDRLTGRTKGVIQALFSNDVLDSFDPVKFLPEVNTNPILDSIMINAGGLTPTPCDDILTKKERKELEARYGTLGGALVIPFHKVDNSKKELYSLKNGFYLQTSSTVYHEGLRNETRN